MPISSKEPGSGRVRDRWRCLAIVGAVAGAMGLLGLVAQASAQSDTGVAASAAGMAVGEANAKGVGPNKGAKKQGPFAKVSGTVTNSLTGDGVGGATVTFATSLVSFSTVTDADGRYAEKLPLATGDYNVSVEAENFNSAAFSVSLTKGKSTLDVPLDPLAPVIVDATVTGDAAPGAVLSAVGTWTIMDGSDFIGAAWMQTEGPAAVIDPPDAASASVSLAGAGGFKAELIHLLTEPPVGEDELPPNVEPPPGEFVGGLQDRFQVVAVNPLALERAGHVALQFAVETTSGIYSIPVDVHAALAWKVSAGIRNVPVDVPVLLHGKDQAMWAWTLSAPSGSAASLMDADTQNPEFMPDVAGLYTVTESESGESVQVFAGTWVGVITGQDADGKPVAANCTGCHNGSFAPDKFTPWAQTGHAERFTTQLNGPFYSPSCFGCHTVGFDLGASNSGFDDVGDYAGFLVSGLLGPNDPVECPDGDWACMLDDFPENAKRANIQCENCHGPNDSAAHFTGDPRTSLSSEVCATCHGELPRHGRFQQWQLSRHANYELAVRESDSGNCSRCHTGNGFLAWLPVLTGEVPGDPLDNVTVGWTEDETHPQTCAICHEPHAIGTTSGIPTDATVRISDNTPPLIAGFQAFGVGRGAMCMTCHNSRRGLRNEATWPTTTDRDRGPHGSVQTDLLMGHNAYFLTGAQLGNRGNHSFVEDSCVNCHMEQTPPPDVLSYNQSGTNHTFFASVGICSRCHGEGFTAAGVQAGIVAQLEVLEGLIEARYIALIDGLLAAGNSLDLDGRATVAPGDVVTGVALSESRGRQALIVTIAGVADPVGPVRLTTVDVIGPDGPATLFDFVAEEVLKASWNWLLVHNDRSNGIHNPTFSNKVLEVAILALS